MLGKNNYNERLRKMELQSKQDHFSIRKLSIGAASVLLGFTFFGLNSQNVKADTVTPETQESQTNKTTSEQQNKTEQTKSVPITETSTKKAELSTFSGLTSFFKDDDKNETVTKPDTSAKPSDSNSKAPDKGASSAVTKPDEDQNKQPADSANGNEHNSTNPADTDNSGEHQNTAPDQTESSAEKDKEVALKAAATVAQVSDWKGFTTALNNGNVQEIDVVKSFAATVENSASTFTFPSRKLVIKSVGSKRNYIDFRGNSPYSSANAPLDLTYENITLYSADYYGVVDTVAATANYPAKVTFKNVDFHGSQLVYCGSNTHIYFEGDNTAETIYAPYKPGTTEKDDSYTAYSANNQQLFEFTGSNNSIDFTGTFTGTTFAGNVIQMNGDNNNVNIAKGAEVTLNPGKTYVPGKGSRGPSGANPAETTSTIFGIIMMGTKQNLNVNGILNINVGQNETYQGKLDNMATTGIRLNQGSSSINIGNGAQVNVKTNGDIPTYSGGRYLVYDGGKVIISPDGALNVTGQNMGDYSGTLVMIQGTADIENGSFNIRLENDPNNPTDAAKGAGTGAITLVDVQGGTLIVNNPTSLVLDAHLNKNASTSIIGNNAINITNVRQQIKIDTGTGQPFVLTLPPFHQLKVKKTNKTISVDNLILLNGKKTLTQEQLLELQKDPSISKLLDAYPDLKQRLASYVDKSFDTIFTDVIQLAFSNAGNPGYNNIQFIPANPSGFLDIDTASVSVDLNEDGSRTVHGKVLNYNTASDGPESDGIFKKLLPGGTNAYITAQLKGSKEGQIWTDPNIDDNPYGQTNDSTLPAQFAAKVDQDGNFTFTIPADQSIKLAKGDKIALTPNANFVSYNPLQSDRPVIADLQIVTLAEAQDQAAKAITDAIADAKSKKPANLTDDQSKAFDDALNQAAQIAKKPGEKDKSVYGAETIKEVNTRKNSALEIIKNALSIAENENTLQIDKQDAITKLENEAGSQINSYPSLKEKITSAKNTAIANIKAATTTSDNLDQVTNDGIAAIDQVAQDYKQDIKNALNHQIERLEDDIATAANDLNLGQKEKDGINALKDSSELTSAKQIAEDKGYIDADNHEGSANEPISVEGHKKTANDNIKSVRDKIAAINKLENAAQEQITNHQDDAETIKDALNEGVDNILNGTDPDGTNGIEAINHAYADKEATSIKSAAESAKERVQKSGLSSDDQKSYLNAIDNAVAAATAKPGTTGYDENKSIYGTTDEAEVKKRKEKALNTFSKEAAKAELAGYAETSTKDLGIAYTDKIKKAVTDGQAKIDQAKDEAAITAEEDEGKKNILKETSKQKLEEVEANVESQLNNVPGLAAPDIDKAIKQAQQLVDSAPSGYNQQIDEAKTISGIDSLRNDGIAALNKLLAEQTAKGERNNALAEATEKIRQNQQTAKQAIDGIEDLTDSQKNDYNVLIDQIADDGINDLQNVDSASIDLNASQIINNINNVVSDAQNMADKNIEKAKQDANKAINDATQAAKDQIDQIPDDQLSQSNKKYYKDQIDQHAKEATDKIATEKDPAAINSDQEDGEANINRDLNDAQISAARSKAIKELQDARSAAKKVITDAHNTGVIDDKTSQDKLNKVDGYYDQATGAIASDHTISDIQSHAKTGIAAINGVADSISQDKDAQALAKQRQDAIDKLNQAAQAVHDHVTKDPNLSSLEKNKYYDQITDAVNQSKQAIQSADKNSVDKELAAGKDALNKIQNNSDLQSAKDKALADLYNEQDNINKQIDGMTTLTSDNKTKLREKVKTAYDAAVNKVKNPSPASTAQINADKNEGIKNIDDVISDVNINKIINQQKLDDYANQAINRIQNATDITDDVKQKTVTAIEKARDDAKQTVENKETITDSNTAEKDGELAIDQAEAQGNGFETSKATSIKNINAAAAAAEERLHNIYDKLTLEEKAEVEKPFDDAIAAIQNVPKDAEDKIKQATNKEQVDIIYKDAINSINAAETKANLAADKAEAKKAIDDAAIAAKENLSDQKDKDAVDAVADLGKNDIDSATTSPTVNKIKDNTLQSIQNIKDIASSDNAEDIKKEKQNAIDALDKELGNTEDGTGVLGDIAKLPNLTSDEKAQYQQQAQEAHDRAVAAIQGAAKDNIATEKNTGISNIDQALVNAKLQSAKNKAKQDLDAAAADAVAKDPNDKDAIENERDKGKENIDQAEDISGVTDAQDKGEGAINGIVDTAENESLKAEKQAAKDKLKADAQKIKDQISKDYQDKKLSQDQYEQLTNKVDQAIKDGETKIDAATTSEELTAAKSKNNQALADISSEISKEESLTAAMNKLQAAVDQANAIADEIGKENPELTKEMKERIESERAKAAKNIQSAKDSANNPNEAMDQAATAGITAIKGVTEDYKNKNEIIQELKQYAQDVKDELNKLNLDNNEINQGEQNINNALNDSISEIYRAGESADLSKLEDDGKKSINNAILPSKLQAEKNEQLSNFDKYVKDKGDIATVASDLTDAQKQDLQKQLDEVIKNTRDKINNVEMQADTDFANAIAQVDNAEKGISEERKNYGEAGVDAIFQAAKDKEGIYQEKQKGIQKIEAEENSANQVIEESGLSFDDQQSQKDKVKEISDNAKAEINALPETADIEQGITNIVDKAKEKLEEIKNQVKLAAAKTKAENILKDKQNDAHEVINQSQLTADEKEQANQQIDDAYEKAKTAIEGQTDVNEIPTSKDKIGQDIDQVWKESSWVGTEKDNATKGAEGVDGLESGLSELTEEQQKNPDYAGYIDDIKESIAAIGQAQNIKEASQAYDKGITALNKLKAKDEIDQALHQAEQEIDNNQDLDQETKNSLKDKAKEHADTGKQKVDQVVAPAGDANAKKDKINQARDEAKNDIQSEVNKALEESKNKADQEIADKHKEAVDKLHDEFGPDADTTEVDHAFEEHKHASGNSYEEIQHDKLEAEKEIGKGAVDDAAANAKDKIDKNESHHADGSDLADKEKETIKGAIDKEKNQAKDEIDHAKDTGEIDKDRNDAIHDINQEGTDPTTIDTIINDHNNGNPDNSGSGSGTSSSSGSEQNNSKKPISDSQGQNTDQEADIDLNKSVEVSLMHNAYLYDQNGTRTNKVVIGVGSVVMTYGVKTINGRDYYILVDPGNHNKRYYMAIGNVKSVSQKLKHNAYVYNQHGKRIKKAGVLKKGRRIQTFGAPVKIRGKKYYIIAKNRYVKIANVATRKVAFKAAKVEVAPTNAEARTITEKKVMHNSYLYNNQGQRANKLIILAGSAVNTVGLKEINGRSYYELEDGLLIAVANIDGQKLELTHNAYIYSQHGNRLGKQVLRKHNTVRTYGDPIRINHKKYYIIAKGKYIKQANFRK